MKLIRQDLRWIKGKTQRRWFQINTDKHLAWGFDNWIIAGFNHPLTETKSWLRDAIEEL